jgi:hypothetical protein
MLISGTLTEPPRQCDERAVNLEEPFALEGCDDVVEAFLRDTARATQR